MKLEVWGIALLLFLYTVPIEAVNSWNPVTPAEATPLAILQIPDTLHLANGSVTRVAVVVGNEGLVPLNVTLTVEQDRSPHEAIPVEPLPSAVIGASSNATLVLELRGVVWSTALESNEWVGSVSTGIYVRAITVDGDGRSDAKLISVRISFLRLTTPVLAAFGITCILIALLCVSIWRRRHVKLI